VIKFGIVEILTLIGSLGLFLFGMKLMSEALQKVAGDKMRSILSSMTSNRVKGLLTGVLITAVIQSSSATTVMVVSFVNAGLLSLIEAIGVIMGANIGTTITAWLISILGFNVKMSTIALPLIGISFPLLFSKNNQKKSWGEFIIGFAILFMGLEFLKDSVPNIKEHPEILEFLSRYTGMGMFSNFIFLIIGTVLTIVIQSSSATMTLTLVMCYNGWIDFEIAASMVLGENIGTTITANIAAIVANVSAKRAALAHLIFNLFGVCWIFFLLPVYIKGIDQVMIYLGSESPFTSSTAMPLGLSAFHSSFNILNALFLIGFARVIEKIVIRLIPQKEDDDEIFKLTHISTGLLSTSELSILQAKNELVYFANRSQKMFGLVKKISVEDKKGKFENLYKKIEKYETFSDKMEVEIASYLTKVSQGELSSSGSKKIKSMFKIVDEIESISDSCFGLARTFKRKQEKKAYFPEQEEKNIRKIFSMIDDAFEEMIINLGKEGKISSIGEAYEIEGKINKFRNELQKDHIESVKQGAYSYNEGVIYNDVISHAEHLGDHIINVSEALLKIGEE
jgi:phosphate:Na+ symporter